MPNAVGHRHGAYTVYATAYPHPNGPMAADGAAEQALLDDLAPWSDGGRWSTSRRPRPADDVRAAYEPDRWTRLVEIKTAWDPGNVFRINHNVPPRMDTGGR